MIIKVHVLIPKTICWQGVGLFLQTIATKCVISKKDNFTVLPTHNNLDASIMVLVLCVGPLMSST